MTRATLDIGGMQAEVPVAPGTEAAAFELDLTPGNSELAARFITADGTVYGAYYVEVERL